MGFLISLKVAQQEHDAFADALSKTERFETAVMTATQNIARELHKELLKRTPVDTGNLRKMWSAGDNLQFYVDRAEGGFEVTLVNEARNSDGYKSPWVVNYGHWSTGGNWVVGRFFVENSVLATSQVAEKYIRKELTKWFRYCVNGK